MTIIETIGGLRSAVRLARTARDIIGCVPTMGALHAGHGVLIERARAASDFVVVTIFVNPIQFDRKDDYERYARQLGSDRAFCQSRGVDVIFAPSATEMYPEPIATHVEAPELARHLCGEFRPGHFRGVATVVAKLFNIVQPDLAFFGEKDAQQLAIIEQMVRDLDFPVEIVPVPTVRETDGLALSSRNVRLSPEERLAAPLIYRALTAGRELAESGERDAAKVKSGMRAVLDREPSIRVEYAEAVDSRMQPVATLPFDARLLIAAWIGNTRLIDNVRCSISG